MKKKIYMIIEIKKYSISPEVVAVYEDHIEAIAEYNYISKHFNENNSTFFFREGEIK